MFGFIRRAEAKRLVEKAVEEAEEIAANRKARTDARIAAYKKLPIYPSKAACLACGQSRASQNGWTCRAERDEGYPGPYFAVAPRYAGCAHLQVTCTVCQSVRHERPKNWEKEIENARKKD